MTDNPQKSTLNRLYSLCRDSENGFLVAAENVRNRGLKAILKTCALERAEFANALDAALQAQGGAVTNSGSKLAMLHRGWIDLKAAMTFGPDSTERVVLAESLLGERVAVRRYQKALAQPLSAPVRELLEFQYQRIITVCDQLIALVGDKRERLVVRLFDRDEDVKEARHALTEAGFAAETIETSQMNSAIRVYERQPQRNTVVETLLAAALLGAGIGGVIGLVVGISMIFARGSVLSFTAPILISLAIAALVGAMIGVGILGALGILIGAGISEEDRYLYRDGVQHGHTLMRVLTRPDTAFQASRIMYQVNAVARSRQVLI